MKRAVLALLVLVGPLHAQSAGQWRGPDHMWASSCSYCHDTGVGPRLRGARPDPKLVGLAVRNGLPGMPAFHPSEISDKELVALGAWLQRQRPPGKDR